MTLTALLGYITLFKLTLALGSISNSMYMSHVVDPENYWYLLANLQLQPLMCGIYLLGCGIYDKSSGLSLQKSFHMMYLNR